MGESKRRKTARELEAQEWISLFGDGSEAVVIICRPERRSFIYRKHTEVVASAVADAKPAKLCFDFNSQNEVHSIDGVFIFVSSAADNPHPITMVACPTCSKKSDEEILKILRAQMADHFKIDQAAPDDLTGAPMIADVVEQTIHGIRLVIVDGHIYPCRIMEIFSRLLEHRKLPRFVFAFRGHNNCFCITDQLYLDFKDLGIEDRFTYKVGFSSLLKNNEEPVGQHSWIECDGWIIDGSNGAAGNPIIFERNQAYYNRLKMTDIKPSRTQGRQHNFFLGSTLPPFYAKLKRYPTPQGSRVQYHGCQSL